jgi:hypothetical protein
VFEIIGAFMLFGMAVGGGILFVPFFGPIVLIMSVILGGCMLCLWPDAPPKPKLPPSPPPMRFKDTPFAIWISRAAWVGLIGIFIYILATDSRVSTFHQFLAHWHIIGSV